MKSTASEPGLKVNLEVAHSGLLPPVRGHHH